MVTNIPPLGKCDVHTELFHMHENRIFLIRRISDKIGDLLVKYKEGNGGIYHLNLRKLNYLTKLSDLLKFGIPAFSHKSLP